MYINYTLQEVSTVSDFFYYKEEGYFIAEDYILKFSLNDQGRMLIGSGERNTDLLEELTGTKIFYKEGRVVIKSQSNSIHKIRAENFFKALMEVAKYVESITERDIIYIFKQCKDGESCKHIVDVYIDKTIIAKIGKKKIYAKSMNQKLYYQAIQGNDVVFAIGPAGTGKTFIPIVDAAYKLKEKKIKKIILTRPIVEAEEKLGFLPGDMMDKVDPYLRPLYDGLSEVFSKEEVDRFIESRTIEVAPLAYMRGRTLDDAYVILDEAQNTTKGQMKLFLTRMGFGSKMIITGDITQVDLPKHVKSGLRQAIETLKEVRRVEVVEFDSSDIVRHPIVQSIVDNFDDHDWI